MRRWYAHQLDAWYLLPNKLKELQERYEIISVNVFDGIYMIIYKDGP